MIANLELQRLITFVDRKYPDDASLLYACDQLQHNDDDDGISTFTYHWCQFDSFILPHPTSIQWNKKLRSIRISRKWCPNVVEIVSGNGL